MREEKTLATVKCFNCCHIFSCQCEIEDIEVLLHTILVYRLRNDNDITLHQETKSCLCSGFAILGTDLCQNRIREEIIPSFCKWSPRFNLAAILLQPQNAVAGFVINPMSDNISFPVDMVAAMKEDMENETKESEGEI